MIGYSVLKSTRLMANDLELGSTIFGDLSAEILCIMILCDFLKIGGSLIYYHPTNFLQDSTRTLRLGSRGRGTSMRLELFKTRIGYFLKFLGFLEAFNTHIVLDSFSFSLCLTYEKRLSGGRGTLYTYPLLDQCIFLF